MAAAAAAAEGVMVDDGASGAAGAGCREEGDKESQE